MKAIRYYFICFIAGFPLASPLSAQTVPETPDPSDIKECYDRGGGDAQRKALACHRVSLPLLKQLVEKRIEIPAPVVNVPPAKRSLWIETRAYNFAPEEVGKLCKKLGYNQGEHLSYGGHTQGIICLE